MSNKRPVVSKLFAPIHGDEPLFAQSLSLGSSDPDHDTLAIVDFAATTKNEALVTHDTSIKTALSDIYVFAISDFPFRDDDAGGHLSAARTPARMIPIIHIAQARVAARRRLLVSMLCRELRQEQRWAWRHLRHRSATELPVPVDLATWIRGRTVDRGQ